MAKLRKMVTYTDYRWEETDTSRVVEYQWKMQQDWFTFQVNADRAASVIEPGGETEFITEHYWGYAHAGLKKSNEYEVTHPKWEQYKVNDYQIDVDYGKVYGPDFAFLNQEQPSTVMLAEGAVITGEVKRKMAE